ncbi:MAG: hypothetical protein HOP29_15975 [Phycisphaerales bacterium]|nr:hypothetical protein [Phycisphaerales bacterium]
MDARLAFCLAFLAETDLELAAVVAAWPTLPDAIKAGIVAMVNAARRCAAPAPTAPPEK